MFRTILALSLLTAAYVLGAAPPAVAQTCWSSSSCGGKAINSLKSCPACLRGKSGGKSWQTAGGQCLKACPKAKAQ